MNIDLVGTWQGSFITDGLWYSPTLFDQDGKYVGNEGGFGPAENDDVTLLIEWQGDYRDYSSYVAGPFYGQLAGTDSDTFPEGMFPVSGFLNEQGFIKMSFYSDIQPQPPDVVQSYLDWTLNACITTSGDYHVLSGGWARTSWSQGILSYNLGTLSVKRQISLKESIDTFVDAPGLRFKK